MHARFPRSLWTFAWVAVAQVLYGQEASGGPKGVWGFSEVLGPAVRGSAIVTRRGNEWSLRAGGLEAIATQRGDTVRLVVPNAGVLRLRVGGLGNLTSALWIQPPIMGPAYASPVRLTRRAPDTWVGPIEPVEERFTLFVHFSQDSLGATIARFRNPEANFGGGRLFRVVVEPGQIGLVDVLSGRRRFTQAYDSSAKTIAFDFGRLMVARPVDSLTSAGYVPRALGRSPYAYRPPAPLADGWALAGAASQGFDESKLSEAIEGIASARPIDNTKARVHSVLVARHGKLVLDEYFYGYHAERLHDLRSASKTFTSVLLGVAMRGGAGVAPETVATPGGATIGQLLTHTSGLACNDDDSNSPGNEDRMQEQNEQRDWYAFARALPQRKPPGTTYAYCSAGVNLVGGMIATATRAWLPEYFDTHIAQPLGIWQYGMNLMPTEQGYSAGGVYMRPRDLLKFAQLYLDGGRWQGKRIVSKAWVARSTARQQPLLTGADDGFAWHRHKLRVGDRDVPSYEASGNGGQYALVVPDYDLVVVVTAGNYGEGRLWLALRQKFIAEQIVAAVKVRD